MQVDYDRIASTYNHRFEPGVARQGVARALRELIRERPGSCVLEVGCGTGHWLAQLHTEACRAIGLDLSVGMLDQAGQRALDLRLVRGRAGWLPFPPGSFDLITCINAIHHFGDARAFVTQAARLLRPGGALAVIGSDPHTGRDAWYVYDYFAGTLEADRTRFPSWGQIVDWMMEAGLEEIACQPVDRIHHSRIGRSVLEDPFLQKNACSQLALLSDEAYAAGLARIHAALATAEARNETVVFRTDILNSMLVGRV